MNSNELTENICALDITFHLEGRSLADALPTESFGNSTSNNKLSADLWLPMCSQQTCGCPCAQRGVLAVGLQYTLSLLSCSQNPLTHFLQNLPFFFYLFQHLSILHHHCFNFLFQPPLIARGTCCSPAIWMLFFVL